MQPQPLDWQCSPTEAIKRWPSELPIAALVSGDRTPASRWSILGVAAEWRCVPAGSAREQALRAFQALCPCAATRRAEGVTGAGHEPPFRGGWIGFLSYELASLLEPRAIPSGVRGGGFELAGGWHCPAAAVHDATTGRWWWCAPARRSPPRLRSSRRHAARIGAIRPRLAPGAYAQMVGRAIELIHAGDVYQANLAQWFDAPCNGSARWIAAAAIETSGARHSAVVETPDGRAVISMSPELFLERRGDRIVTRPIKGTRPPGADHRELFDSEKDRAELAMIVDLMRNDLSRFCRTASVRVVAPRRIESHCGVEHAVAEITGSVRHGTTVEAILRATFPPGSVTGAPKIRAMQVIDSLERDPRGPYCGSVGLIGADGDLALNVAIRTLLLREGVLSCAVGCGIVADSRPDEEEAESLIKLEPFRRLASRLAVTPRGAAVASAAPGS